MKDLESNTNHSSSHSTDSEELVNEGDAVIGQALKWSAFAAVFLLICGFIAYNLLKPKEKKITAVNSVIEAPEQRVIPAKEYVPEAKSVSYTHLTLPPSDLV